MHITSSKYYCNTISLSRPPSYLVLSHSSSWRSYFCENIG